VKDIFHDAALPKYVKIYCRGCEKEIGQLYPGTEAQLKEESQSMREELHGHCPYCDRELWPETKKDRAREPAIPLRFFT